MRAALIALVLGATTLAAQVPQAPTPGTGIPTGPVVPENAKPRGTNAELRISGFTVSGDRSYDFFNNVSTETGSVQGVEVLLRHTGIGLGFRSWTAKYGNQPNVASADARLYLFPPVFSIMVGAGRRAVWSELNEDAPSQTDFALGGVSSTVKIGGSGLRTNVSAIVMVAAPKKDAPTTDKPSTGLEGEASILWRIPKLPLFMQVGYRTEVFTAKGSSFETPEESRGLRIGGGLQLGGR